jgi:hypothetical protein
VANGNIDVGSENPTRQSGQSPVEHLAVIKASSGLRTEPSNPLSKARPRVSVAMAQQCGDSGHQSAPQKLVHLVGCRDSKARPTPWVRPSAAPAKR